MEAMAMERLVIAPNISGVPEVVTNGANGFLYDPNSMDDFLDKLQMVMRGGPSMNKVRLAARRRIISRFNSTTNLADFASRFLEVLATPQTAKNHTETDLHENPVLQQI
jgi:glycosyltransferase involved in cell wall biosynthesis